MDARKRVWIYSGIALAAGVGLVVAASPGASGPQPVAGGPPKPRLGSGSRLLLVGDSFAQGLAPPLGELAKGLGVAFRADGRLGTRIAQWAAQPWLSADLAWGPTMVLVSLGTNDMKLPQPAVEQPALAQLAARLKSSGGRVVWLNPPTMPFPDRGVRAMIAATGLEVFHSEALQLPRGPDGIHPTVSSYAGWAGSVWRWVG
jgi:lysophospholipase L1-like esterase